MSEGASEAPADEQTIVVAEADVAEAPSAGSPAPAADGDGASVDGGGVGIVVPAFPDDVTGDGADGPVASGADLAAAEPATPAFPTGGAAEGELVIADAPVDGTAPSDADATVVDTPLFPNAAEDAASDPAVPADAVPAPEVDLADSSPPAPEIGADPAAPALGDGPVVVADLPAGAGIASAPEGSAPARPGQPEVRSAPETAGSAPAPDVSLPAAPPTAPDADEAPIIVAADAPDPAPAPASPDVPRDVAEAPRVILAEPGRVTVLQDAAPPPPIALDSIAYDDQGAVTLSGRGEEGDVRLYVDNRPVKTVRIEADGSWEAGLPEVDPGIYTLRLDRLGADGAVSDRIETPFKKETRSALAAVRAGPEGPAIVTVQPGFTLWAIAAENYGDGAAYVKIFEANASRVRNPDLIYPGQVFAVPD